MSTLVGNKFRPSFWISALFFLAGSLLLGFWVEQADFSWIIAGFLLMFAPYAWVLLGANGDLDWKKYLWLAGALRILLLFAMPGLSDDLYRFIWDGRLLTQGINPFSHLPAWYLEAGNEVSGLTPNLYASLNSPEYYTIYPPVAQAVFGLACWVSPKSLYGAMLVMKLFLVLCELFSLYLLPRILTLLKMPAERSLIYALNPLIIIEISGNLHFEGAMICFFLAGLYLILAGRERIGGLAMGLSIASKLLTLIFMPFFIRRIGWNKVIPLFIFCGGICLLLFLPLFSESFFGNFGESLDLYFRKFEFNASVYYLSRWVGYQLSGFNLIAYIGPGLALTSGLGILAFAFFHPGNSWKATLKYMLYGICLYLALTTTVHPWYLSLPVLLCGFTSYRFPLIWSFMITLTYINYSYDPYWENLWIVALEYGIVAGVFLWEAKKYSALGSWRLFKRS
ncbi:MAG: hypothetical protein GYB31_17020 [Bacteroidetes bacterium]|nr:hypothetical protein [Bacteroidota bacterium]